MELEEFLDLDIVAFLDGVSQAPRSGPVSTGAAIPSPLSPIADQSNASLSSVFLTRDYEKELMQALAREDMSQAKRVLHDLKEKFDEYPNGTPDKEQMKVLLFSLYDRFKEHLDTQQTRHEIDAMMDPHAPVSLPPVSKDAPPPPPSELQRPSEQPRAPTAPAPPTAVVASTSVDAPNVAPPSMAVPSSPIVQAPVRPIPTALINPLPSPSPLAEIMSTLSDAETALAKNDSLAAMRHYRAARRQALDMKQVPDDVAKRFSLLFEKIQKLVPHDSPSSSNKHSTLKTPPHTEQQSFSTSPKDMDAQFLLQIEREKRVLDDCLAKNDFTGAIAQYRSMRVLVQQLSNPVTAESAAKKLIRIHSLIGKMHSHLSREDKALVRKVP